MPEAPGYVFIFPLEAAHVHSLPSIGSARVQCMAVQANGESLDWRNRSFKLLLGGESRFFGSAQFGLEKW